MYISESIGYSLKFMATGSRQTGMKNRLGQHGPATERKKHDGYGRNTKSHGMPWLS
jgi:hypothetical protein